MVAETARRPRPLSGVLCGLMLTFGLALLAPASLALDLYQVSVPVADQSQSARRGAERKALELVLERLTGDSQALERDEIRAALQRPQDYFQRSGYARMRDRELIAEYPDAQWMLEMQADRAAVLGLLSEARLPAWTGRRPEVLVIMLLEDERGDRDLLEPTATEIRTLRRAARELALPVSVPMLDLEDRLQADLGALWAHFPDAAAPFVQRYRPDAVLTVRLYQDADGAWRSDWQGEIAGRQLQGSSELDAREAIGPLLVRELMQSFTERYALRVGAGADEGEWLWLQVDGLSDTHAYAGMMGYLDGLSAVATVRLVEVQGSSVLLQIQSADAIPRLLEMLRLEQRLAPADAPESVGGGELWRAWWRAGQS